MSRTKRYALRVLTVVAIGGLSLYFIKRSIKSFWAIVTGESLSEQEKKDIADLMIRDTFRWRDMP